MAGFIGIPAYAQSTRQTGRHTSFENTSKVSGSRQASPAPVRQAAANVLENGRNLRISLLTFGPGRVYWERFGHDAIKVENAQTGTAIDYNYGIFDFNQKHFFLNFARGNMRYRMAADPFQADLDFYASHGRSVTEQRLNLTPAQRVELVRFLRWNVLPANASYRYDYFLSNCATRVRDALNRALAGQLQTGLAAQAAAAGHSYRFDAVRALSPDTWLAMIMDIALGPAADKPLNLWQESFLPAELSRAIGRQKVKNAQGQSVPLVTHTTVLVSGRIQPMPSAPPDWLPLLLAIGLATAVVLLLLYTSRKWLAARIAFGTLAGLISLAFGLAGVALALIWGITAHWSGWYNENLLLFDPLCLLLIPAWIAAMHRHWRPRLWSCVLACLIAIAAAAALGVRVIPGIWQSNLHWVALALPVHVVLAGTLFRQQQLCKKQK